MKASLIAGIVLILLGIAGLVYGGFSFTQREKVLDVGPIHATADKEKSVPIPPILSFAAIGGGIVLVVLGARAKA